MSVPPPINIRSSNPMFPLSGRDRAKRKVMTGCAHCTGLLWWSSAMRNEGKRPVCIGHKYLFSAIVDQDALDEQVKLARDKGLFPPEVSEVSKRFNEAKETRKSLGSKVDDDDSFFHSTDLNPEHSPKKENELNVFGHWHFFGLGKTLTSNATEQVGLPPHCIWGTSLLTQSTGETEHVNDSDGEWVYPSISSMKNKFDSGFLKLKKFWEPTLNRELPHRMFDMSCAVLSKMKENTERLPYVITYIPNKIMKKMDNSRNDKN